MTELNGGYVHYGNNNVHGSAAIGPHATVNTSPPPAATDDAVRQLDALLTLIHENRHQLPDPDVALQIALKARTALTAPTPDPDKITGTVTRLTTRLKSAAALTTAATTLHHTVTALFS